MSAPRDRDPFVELQAALDVEPSPGFAARTRTRLAATRRRRSVALWLAPAIAAAAAVVVAVASWPGAPELVGTVQTTLGAPEVATYVPAPPGPRVTLGPPRATPRSAPPEPEAPRAPTAPVPTARSASQPDLEVVTNQPEILRRLWASPTRWDVAEAEPATDQQGPVVTAVPPPDMTVFPIIVAPIVVDPMTVVRGGLSVPIQRHAVAPDATRSQ